MCFPPIVKVIQTCKKNSYLTEIEKFENRNSLASHPPEIMASIGSVLILCSLCYYIPIMLLLFLHNNIVYTFKEHGLFFSFMISSTVDRSHPIIETLDF